MTQQVQSMFKELQFCVIVGTERNKTHKTGSLKTPFRSGVERRLCVATILSQKKKLETLYITTNWVKISDN